MLKIKPVSLDTISTEDYEPTLLDGVFVNEATRSIIIIQYENALKVVLEPQGAVAM